VSASKVVIYALLSGVVLSPTLDAQAFDVLQAEGNVPSSAAAPFVAACEFDDTPKQPLWLVEAVERTLCSNPKSRQAWVSIKAQSAALGAARAAYLPTLSASWQGVRDHALTDIEGHPTLGSETTATVRSASANLNWLLYDFGGREAALKNANALLEAARATQDATLLALFSQAAKDYASAQTAIGALDVAEDVARTTRESSNVAQARVDRGVSPVSDALQAQTQHEEAVFSLTKARSDAQSALGTLASDMNLNPSIPLLLPSVTENAVPDTMFGQSIEQLIRTVQDTHPSVQAARAQYEAALAKVAQTRAAGLPQVSLIGKYTQNNQPQSLGLGLPTYQARGHDAYIGVQVSIPLFEGFERHYQIDQAVAQAQWQENAIDDAKRQAGLEVWTSYQALIAAVQNVTQSAHLLGMAQRAYDASLHRYDAGVGNILELLNTQAALANAKQRRVKELANLSYARIDLATKLGILDRDRLQKIE
jgi:outer membrane protein